MSIEATVLSSSMYEAIVEQRLASIRNIFDNFERDDRDGSLMERLQLSEQSKQSEVWKLTRTRDDRNWLKTDLAAWADRVVEREKASRMLSEEDEPTGVDAETVLNSTSSAFGCDYKNCVNRLRELGLKMLQLASLSEQKKMTPDTLRHEIDNCVTSVAKYSGVVERGLSTPAAPRTQTVTSDSQRQMFLQQKLIAQLEAQVAQQEAVIATLRRETDDQHESLLRSEERLRQLQLQAVQRPLQRTRATECDLLMPPSESVMCQTTITHTSLSQEEGNGESRPHELFILQSRLEMQRFMFIALLALYQKAKRPKPPGVHKYTQATPAPASVVFEQQAAVSTFATELLDGLERNNTAETAVLREIVAAVDTVMTQTPQVDLLNIRTRALTLVSPIGGSLFPPRGKPKDVQRTVTPFEPFGELVNGDLATLAEQSATTTPSSQPLRSTSIATSHRGSRKSLSASVHRSKGSNRRSTKIEESQADELTRANESPSSQYDEKDGAAEAGVGHNNRTSAAAPPHADTVKGSITAPATSSGSMRGVSAEVPPPAISSVQTVETFAPIRPQRPAMVNPALVNLLKKPTITVCCQTVSSERKDGSTQTSARDALSYLKEHPLPLAGSVHQPRLASHESAVSAPVAAISHGRVDKTPSPKPRLRTADEEPTPTPQAVGTLKTTAMSSSFSPSAADSITEGKHTTPRDSLLYSEGESRDGNRYDAKRAVAPQHNGSSVQLAARPTSAVNVRDVRCTSSFASYRPQLAGFTIQKAPEPTPETLRHIEEMDMRKREDCEEFSMFRDQIERLRKQDAEAVLTDRVEAISSHHFIEEDPVKLNATHEYRPVIPPRLPLPAAHPIALPPTLSGDSVLTPNGLTDVCNADVVAPPKRRNSRKQHFHIPKV